MPAETPDPGPAIVLVEPQLGENIGTAARAMANFGLTDLRLVKPRDGWPNEKARKAASGADFVIDSARVFASLAEAISDLNYVMATTARPRDLAKPVATAEEAARTMVTRIAAGQKVGILFGRERWGLENDEVSLADELMTFPANPDFASFNLAQAVLLVGYEWFKAAGRADVDTEGFIRTQEPASRGDLLALFEHLERALDEAGFLHPPEKRPAMVRNLRAMLHRARLSDQEVRSLRGVIKALTGEKARRRGSKRT
jgi:tRNA/rRNA methyltransferase